MSHWTWFMLVSRCLMGSGCWSSATLKLRLRTLVLLQWSDREAAAAAAAVNELPKGRKSMAVDFIFYGWIILKLTYRGFLVIGVLSIARNDVSVMLGSKLHTWSHEPLTPVDECVCVCVLNDVLSYDQLTSCQAEWPLTSCRCRCAAPNQHTIIHTLH